jgi:16S rRNA (cytidine1402-2'-O)-methyltransferase
MQQAGLYVVATPIGNLEDISQRALSVLAEADIVVAEDTRRSRILLTHYGIDRALVSFHEHNELERIPALLDRLGAGQSVALISDAGTPLVSDPGYRLVREAAARGLAVISVPGPSAVTAALSVAGLPTDRFVFEGFLPAKSTMRRKRLAELQYEARTVVFFESSHRVLDSLRDLAQVLSHDRPAVVCRELTKRFETVLRGTLGQLVRQLEGDANQRKGEFVILVAGCAERPATVDGLQLARQLLEFLPTSQAARVAARLTGQDRRALYDALQADPD